VRRYRQRECRSWRVGDQARRCSSLTNAVASCSSAASTAPSRTSRHGGFPWAALSNMARHQRTQRSVKLERRPASSSATRDRSSSHADSPGTSRARSTTKRSGSSSSTPRRSSRRRTSGRARRAPRSEATAGGRSTSCEPLQRRCSPRISRTNSNAFWVTDRRCPGFPSTPGRRRGRAPIARCERTLPGGRSAQNDVVLDRHP
jgi:hypothetical protein